LPARQRCAEACARAGVTLAEQTTLVRLYTTENGRAGAQQFSEKVALAYQAAGDRMRALCDPKARRSDDFGRTSEALRRFDELQACVRALWLAVMDESREPYRETTPAEVEGVAQADPLDALAERLKL
jgi:hypothetical protein